MKNWSLLLFCLFLGLLTSASGAALNSVEVEVRGLSDGPFQNVKAALTLPPGLVERDGTVNRPWLDYFVERMPAKVRAALEPYGYYEAQTLVKKVEEEGKYRIEVDVSPGKPILLSSVDLQIEGPGAANKVLSGLAASFPLKKGAILRQDIYEEAKENLKGKARELGYVAADFSVHSILVSLEKHEAEITLVLQTGPEYRFGEITFSGAPSYPKPFLRRYLTFHEGDVFSANKIGESQFNLSNADRFKDVRIIADKTAAKDNLIPIDVTLKQGATKLLKTGIWYTTDIGPRISVQYRDVNVFDRGQEFSSELNLSGPIQALVSSYKIPDMTDFRNYTSFNLKLQREDLHTYTTKSASLELEKTRSFGQGKLGSLLATALIENSDSGDETTNTFSLYPGVRFSGRHYDNLKRPTKGYYYQAEVRGTHQVLGSYTGFLQSILEGNFLIPLPGRFSFFTRLKAAGTLQNEAATDLPIPLRFFAGGDRSVRGYSYQSLGPKDDSGNVVGGKNLFAGSVQIERAIGNDWGIVAFYDAGNAFNNFPQMDLAQGAGLGVRYYTPVGPIELDIARQIGVESPGYRVHISLGFSL